jgi:hypothetical protein
VPAGSTAGPSSIVRDFFGNGYSCPRGGGHPHRCHLFVHGYKACWCLLDQFQGGEIFVNICGIAGGINAVCYALPGLMWPTTMAARVDFTSTIEPSLRKSSKNNSIGNPEKKKKEKERKKERKER